MPNTEGHVATSFLHVCIFLSSHSSNYSSALSCLMSVNIVGMYFDLYLASFCSLFRFVFITQFYAVVICLSFFFVETMMIEGQRNHMHIFKKIKMIVFQKRISCFYLWSNTNQTRLQIQAKDICVFML